MKIKKENLIKKIIPINFIIPALIISFFIYFSSASSECYNYKDVCYKTECNFWGCHRIRVDINSPTCETIEKECISRSLYSTSNSSAFTIPFLVLMGLGIMFKIINWS